MRFSLHIALIACLGAAPQTVAAQSPVVKLETVNAGDPRGQRVFFGRVVARETVDLAFQVGGQIVQYPVEEGAAVKQGELLAEMDLTPFELALEQAKAQADQANRAVERFLALSERTVAESTLQDAQTQAELALIAVRNAERDLRNATLLAPFDGIVAEKIVPNFSTVPAGSAAIRLHDMSDLRIEIDVPETLFQAVGEDPTVTTIAHFPSDDRSFPVELREFNAETAQTGQTYTLTLGTTPPDDLFVLPGASAEVTASREIDSTGFQVPQSAIVVENDQTTSVMVFSPGGGGDDSDGTVVKTPVEITPTANGDVTVVSGLEDGQEIVLIGAAELSDGDAVRRFAGFGSE